MILGTDGKKLSKRHGATAVGDYQEQGIFPAAMRNFLALLGWSPGGDREILPEDEMIELFTLEGIQKKAAVFDTTKLEWMNGQYLSALPADELLEPVRRRSSRAWASTRGTRPRPAHRRGEGPLAHHSPGGRAGRGAARSRRARRSTPRARR